MGNLISEIKKRVGRLGNDIERENLDAILVSIPENILYLTGNDSGQVLISKDDAILWVKDLYRKIHRDLYSGRGYVFDIRTYGKDIIGKEIKKLKIKKLGIENLTIKNYNKLKEDLKSDIVITDLVEKRRIIKSRYEIDRIRKSSGIAKKGMEKAYDILNYGVVEQDAAAEIEFEIRRNGSETPPFKEGMLLASGRNGADIHAKPGMKKIGRGLVVADLGARYSGYYSDMTRTIPIGKLNSKEMEILEFVKNLEIEAIDRLKTGMMTSEIHNFVERKIKSLGYKFYHSTGHGIGLNVHEIPNIGPESEDILRTGMVFTIEPGIYIPDKFGVRFEDTVLLKRNRTEILTELEYL